MCKEILICSSLSKDDRNGSGTLKRDWKPSLSYRWDKFQVKASYFHLRRWAAVWSVLCGPLPANCRPSGDALWSVPQTHFCLHFIWLASLRRWERMHLKLTLPHCTQFTLLLLFFIFANKGQQALTAHKENVCVLLRAIWLGHKLLSRRGGMEDWWKGCTKLFNFQLGIKPSS